MNEHANDRGVLLGDHPRAFALPYEPAAGGFPRGHSPGQVEGFNALLAKDAGGSPGASPGSTRDNHRAAFRETFGCLGAHVSRWYVDGSRDMAGIPFRVLADIKQTGAFMKHLHRLIRLYRRQLKSVEEPHGTQL